MAFKHYRDCLFEIDQQSIFVNDVSISSSASIDPVFKQGNKRNESVAATGPVKTTVNLNYALTGADPIKVYIDNQSNVMSGDFAGFYFPSGYLSSYSLSAEPNKPVAIRASIDIFGELQGSYVAKQSSETPVTLSHVNTSLTQMTSDYSSESFTNANSISYDYRLDVIPEYVQCTGDAGQYPYRVYYSEKTLEMTVKSDNTKMSLPITGDQAGLILKVRNKNNATVETYSCSGVLTNRNMSVAVGEELSSEYTIKQWHMTNEPQVTGFCTVSHSPNGVIAFKGNNLESVKSAKIGSHYIKNLRYTNECVTGSIPAYALSGDLKVTTEWGEKTSDVYIPNWTYPAISISQVTPAGARGGESVIISGDNFYDISSVKFYNNKEANYRVLTSKAISATVPDTATIGVITVTSSERGDSANSSSFTPYPTITSLGSPEAAVGDTITIYGTNFANISDVKFNSISATTFNVSSTTVMSAQVPDGNNAGTISLHTTAGYISYSPYPFWPTLGISSVTKANDKIAVGESIILHLNQTVNSQMLYTTGDSKYLVQFGNNSSVGFTLNVNQLEGNVPENAETGPAHILRPDGASVYGSGYWFDVYPSAPLIKEIIPTTVQYEGNTSIDFLIRGGRFKDIQKIILAGGYVNEDGSKSTAEVALTSSDFSTDAFGKTLIAHNNTKMSSIATGYYDVIVTGDYLGAGLPLMKDEKIKAFRIR